MTITLAGGCLVRDLREGTPRTRDGIAEWPLFGRATGAAAISLRALELPAGGRGRLVGGDCDEVLYVLEGRGRALLDGRAYELEMDTGLYVAPGTTCELESAGSEPLLLASSRCPEPTADAPAPDARAPGDGEPHVRLVDSPSETTGDRWYKTMIGRAAGCEQVTQFVGAIPPGRAPDHFHHYEEVLCILRGEGRMWAGETSAPIAPGACIYLPREQVHCVENTGTGMLVLLGVFYPAGSPAVRYETGSSA